MSVINNTWVGYLNRSFQTIKNSLLSKVTNSNPELTDHSESNIFVIIISMFSGIGEMLSYYIDSAGREAYMSVAQRRSSIIYHSKPLDYRIKANMYESVDVTFSIVDGVGDPVNLAGDITVPAGTSITTDGGITFVTLVDYIMTAGSNIFNIPFVQATLQSNVLLGTSDGTSNQRIALPADYVDGTIDLDVGAVDYDNIDSWALAVFDDTSYIVEVLYDNSIVVEFGDDTRGAIPVADEEVRASFYTTLGPNGSIEAGELTTAPSITLGSGENLNVNNPLPSSGGAFIEATEDIRKNAIYGRRTNDRMVTELDHKDVVEAIAGVAKAKVSFACAKNFDIYVVPEGGGIASQQLLDNVDDVVTLKKMVGTDIAIRATGETIFYIEATAIAKKNRDLVETRQDIENALIEFGSEVNQEINNPIRTSDITATIYNLEKVEYVDLDIMYTKPYAAPQDHSIQLDWDRITKAGSTATVEWILEYNGGNISVTRDRTFLATVAVGAQYSDSEVEFTVNSGSYSNGQRWIFYLYNYTDNIFLEDFTIPKIQLADLNINVVEG